LREGGRAIDTSWIAGTARRAGTRLGLLSLAFAALIGLWPSGLAKAHFTSTAYSDIDVGERELRYVLYLPEHDALESLPTLDADGNGSLSDDELRLGKTGIGAFVNSGVVISGDGKLAAGETTGVAFDERSGARMVRVDLRYGFEQPVERYMLQYGLLFRDIPDHRNFASIRVGEHTIDQVLSASNTILQIAGGEGAPAAAAASGPWTDVLTTYVRMGVEHIWGGLDHLLFVLALLLHVRTWKQVLAAVTAFTVGHSVTLVLSALELASLSPLIVEPLIALSIVYVAAENWFRDAPTRSRLQLTALFGLAHGFGFAEVLHGALSGSVALPLFAFNLGVELGQLAVVALALPLLWAARRYAKGAAQWPRYASVAVGAFGLYWFVERVIENLS